jgi:hypothetical protein
MCPCLKRRYQGRQRTSSSDAPPEIGAGIVSGYRAKLQSRHSKLVQSSQEHTEPGGGFKLTSDLRPDLLRDRFVDVEAL